MAGLRIKGTAISTVVEDVKRLVDQGQISSENLELRLEASDLKLLEALADFFPQSEWSAMQSSLTIRKSQPEMTPEEMQLARGFLKMDPEVLCRRQSASKC